MNYQGIINEATERVKDIASDIRTRTSEEVMELYFVTYIGEKGIFSHSRLTSANISFTSTSKDNRITPTRFWAKWRLLLIQPT